MSPSRSPWTATANASPELDEAIAATSDEGWTVARTADGVA